MSKDQIVSIGAVAYRGDDTARDLCVSGETRDSQALWHRKSPGTFFEAWSICICVLVAARRMGLVALALAFATGGTATAQWVSVPVPGTPRTSDGVPDLEAPTPRTAGGKPDLSGIWRAESYQWVNHLLPPGEVEPFQPWAAELAERRRSTQSHELPMTFCMPHGVPDAQLVHGHPFKIVQTPNLMIHLYEEFTKYRQIHTDGRELPVDPNPAWYGYSVGHWEDDTFVVESAGFKLGSWLTNQGAPHTEALRVTERYRRVNFGYMEIVVTIDDPEAYTEPWTSDTIRMHLLPDTELIEHLCENNRDLERLLDIYGGGQRPGTAERER